MDDAELIEESSALINERPMANVVRGLDVVAQGAVKLAGRLTNRESGACYAAITSL